MGERNKLQYCLLFLTVKIEVQSTEWKLEEERIFFFPFSRTEGVGNEVSLDPDFPVIDHHDPQLALMLFLLF